MGLRVPITIKYREKAVQTQALLNTGFETDEPVIVIPLTVAIELGLKPREKRMYYGPGALIGEAYLSNKITIEVARENEVRTVQAHALIDPHEVEVVLSDKTIAELGIVIDLRRNTWWFT